MFKRSSVVFPILLAVMLALLLYFNREELSVSSVEPIVDKAMWQLSFAHNTPEDSALHQAALRFKQQLESRAGGRSRRHRRCGDDGAFAGRYRS